MKTFSYSKLVVQLAGIPFGHFYKFKNQINFSITPSLFAGTIVNKRKDELLSRVSLLVDINSKELQLSVKNEELLEPEFLTNRLKELFLLHKNCFLLEENVKTGSLIYSKKCPKYVNEFLKNVLSFRNNFALTTSHFYFVELQRTSFQKELTKNLFFLTLKFDLKNSLYVSLKKHKQKV